MHRILIVTTQVLGATSVAFVTRAFEPLLAEPTVELGEGNERGSLVQLSCRCNACLDPGVLRRGSVDVYGGRYGATVCSGMSNYCSST